MRFILRVIGTLLIACALVLLIIDGTRSLGANTLILTSLESSWLQWHAASLEALQHFVGTRLFGPLLETLVATVLKFPGWAVIGVPGVLLAWAGRSRRERVFLRQDQI